MQRPIFALMPGAALGVLATSALHKADLGLACSEGPGRGPGRFAESNYIVMDKGGNIHVGDTA